MSTYRKHPEAIAALVRDAEVHKDCYVSDEVFALEMEHLFANTWVYVGHASQVPNEGDFYATTVARRLGFADEGFVRAGCACYSTADEIARLVDGVRALVHGR